MYPIDLVGKNRSNELETACRGKNVLEIVDHFGNTALLKACYLGAYSDFKILLKHKADVLAMNCYGQNTLSLATYSGDKRIVLDLLKLQMSPQILSSCMMPPICVAAFAGHTELYNLFSKMEKADPSVTVHGLTATDLIKIKNTVKM